MFKVHVVILYKLSSWMKSISESVLQCYWQNGDSVNNDNDDY